MTKIYCFGNEFLKQDSLAKEVADELTINGYEFVKCSAADEIFEEKGEIIIMDAAQGVDKVQVFDDVNKLQAHSLCSLHDFDLGFFLKLMKELGKLQKVKIIALPINGNKEDVKRQIKNAVRRL